MVWHIIRPGILRVSQKLKRIVRIRHFSFGLKPQKNPYFCSVQTGLTGIEEEKYGFYHAIRPGICSVLVPLYGRITSLSYNNKLYLCDIYPFVYQPKVINCCRCFLRLLFM